MEELSKHGKLGRAAMNSDMHRNTAGKYRETGKLPSQMRTPRTWRTREDVFAADWPMLKAMLKAAPELEAKSLFEYLVEIRPGKYEEGQLRTFQRRVREWRAKEGPPKEVFFPQEHRPGEAMQTDFTWATVLGVTIGGEAFKHMLCHAVLPYSNWEWATVCFSESMAALRHGVQEAVFHLGRVPKYSQTDHSTAATHNLRDGRDFNDEYKALMNHLGMEPRTIAVGEKQQNGDVESLNGALKRRIKQHLLLRGSFDFESVAEYKQWLQKVFERANGLRTRRLQEELAVMRPLQVKRLPEYSEIKVRVSSWSTINVKRNIYSVPSRLRDEMVTVRAYDDRLEVFHGASHQLTVPRLRGEGRHQINYRHIIWSLIHKPNAFARYRYREDLFPSMVFRRAYDSLQSSHSVRKADMEYLRLLHLAASTMESDVEVAIEILLEQGLAPGSESVKDLVSPEKVEIPDMPAPKVELDEYDVLLDYGQEMVG